MHFLCNTIIIYLFCFSSSFYVYCHLVNTTQVLRDFNHVNPQDDEEGKMFVGERVCLFSSVDPENIHL